MAELQPQDNGTFRVTGLSSKLVSVAESVDDIQSACQKRLDIVAEVTELLGDNEVELDMSDSVTASVVKAMAMSAEDHFLICDFEMSQSIAEIVLELDPEDHFSVMDTLVYSYAMSADIDAVQQLLPFTSMSAVEKELVIVIAKFQNGDVAVSVPKEIKEELADDNSYLSMRTAHLWLEIPKLKKMIKTKK